jgi:hypothetical protein
MSERWAQMMGLPGATAAGNAGAAPSTVAGDDHLFISNPMIKPMESTVLLRSTCDISMDGVRLRLR